MKKPYFLLLALIICLTLNGCRKKQEVPLWDGSYPEEATEGLSFSEEPINYLMPDGTTRDVVEMNIDSPEAFAYFFGRSNIGSFSDKKAVKLNLVNDIYLNSKPWQNNDITALSEVELVIIDGMGHTVYGLCASGEYPSLFRAENCHLLIINLTLANSKINADTDAAAFISTKNGKYSVVNCALDNITISAKGDIGGFLLSANGQISDCALYKITLTANSPADYVNAGGLAADITDGVVRDVSFTDVTLKAKANASEKRHRIGLFTAVCASESYITGKFIVNNCRIDKTLISGTSELIFTDNRTHRIFDNVAFVR